MLESYMRFVMCFGGISIPIGLIIMILGMGIGMGDSNLSKYGEKLGIVLAFAGMISIVLTFILITIGLIWQIVGWWIGLFY